MSLVDMTTSEEVRANDSFAKMKLEKRGIKTLSYDKGGVSQRFILDTRNTENYPGLKLWKFIDYLVTFRGFSFLTEKSFEDAEREKRALNRIRGKVVT